jgi:hypothetical protein
MYLPIARAAAEVQPIGACAAGVFIFYSWCGRAVAGGCNILLLALTFLANYRGCTESVGLANQLLRSLYSKQARCAINTFTRSRFRDSSINVLSSLPPIGNHQVRAQLSVKGVAPPITMCELSPSASAFSTMLSAFIGSVLNGYIIFYCSVLVQSR